jgi:hypothetical protein
MNNLIAALAFAWNLISQPLLALITTLIVLLIGFVIARFIGFIITHSLKLIQLDKWTKTGKGRDQKKPG